MPHDIFHLLEPAYRSFSRQQVRPKSVYLSKIKFCFQESLSFFPFFFNEFFESCVMSRIILVYSFQQCFSEFFLDRPFRSGSTEWQHRCFDFPIALQILAPPKMGLVSSGQPGNEPEQLSRHQDSQHSGKAAISPGKSVLL